MTERPIDRLLAVMAKLRHPDDGCPWDLEQTFRTIAPHTIEEAYEVVDAIERDDMHALRDECGDLLFQVVYYAQMAREAGHFDFDDVATAIADKMISRHPHVFGGESRPSAEGQTSRWEDQKARERAVRADGRRTSVLDGVTPTLPAITRAMKLQNRVARVGFDWPGPEPVFEKLDEEIGELRAEIEAGARQDRIADELGDLLFVVVNLARKLGIDPETALRSTNAKFERRFRHIEDALAADGKSPTDVSLEAMERLWQAAKSAT